MALAGLPALAAAADLNPARGPLQLRNASLAVTVSAAGALTQIENLSVGETYLAAADDFTVVTARSTFGNRAAQPVKVSGDEHSLRFEFTQPGEYDVALVYTLAADRNYLERHLVCSHFAAPCTLLRIELGHTRFSQPPTGIVDYPTFYNAPTVSFLRWTKGGLFTGIENPFFACTHEGVDLALAFEPQLQLTTADHYASEPQLQLTTADHYASEPQFIGVYQQTGVRQEDYYPQTVFGRRPRFYNPAGYLPLDRGEVRAMQRFARSYLEPATDRFRFILYNWFYPLPAMPAPHSPEEAIYLRMLDNFRAIGGDLVVFNPLTHYQKPGAEDNACWDLAPPGSAAATIFEHARRLGLALGNYMGTAGGQQGNAAALPFRPEHADWKKRDAQTNEAGENSIASAGFADWFFAVQRNTIARFKLALWSWDPGPGNALFSFADNHGHVPGHGEYKGWRDSTAMMRRLKEEIPGLYIQMFYGRKEYGLWGLKYADQHESYWEQTLPYGASIHPELHADRSNADGIRLQSWWNNNFRFLPNTLNCALVHRIQEGAWDPRLNRAWDYLGWRYSVLSGLAVSGTSLTTVILPENVADVPGLRAFYAKWLGWARQNIGYARYNVAFGEPLRVGGVDGWARIKDEHGFIFLCNPNPRPARISFGLDDEVGLAATGKFILRELHPSEGRNLTDSVHRDGVFAAGDRVSAVVPALEIRVLELARPTSRETTDPPAAPPASTLPRWLDDWHLPDGSGFAFPANAAAAKLTLTTSFRAAPAIRAALAAAKPSNLASWQPLVAEWRRKYPDNFAWARPDRLWLVLPFVDANQIGGLFLRLNGQPIAMECHAVAGTRIIYYADLTDAVQWDRDNSLQLELTGLPAQQFLGPYLDYPETNIPAASSTVVFDRVLDSDLPPRVSLPASMPKIVSATLLPPQLQEGERATINVKVNLPREQIGGVFCSGLQDRDHEMAYDPATGQWSYSWINQRRSDLIIDPAAFEVWPVAGNGSVGARIKVPIAWSFAPAAR